MANGQRQDSWLACAVVWGVILSKDSDLQDPLCAAGFVVLVWLVVRTSRRLIALSRAMRPHDGG
jgi:threonine/homoserine/homoserine lactone efflux protein